MNCCLRPFEIRHANDVTARLNFTPTSPQAAINILGCVQNKDPLIKYMRELHSFLRTTIILVSEPIVSTLQNFDSTGRVVFSFLIVQRLVAGNQLPGRTIIIISLYSIIRKDGRQESTPQWTNER